ncbi:MAG: FixH family protein [Thiobacillaceae bacterium]|nr:FixH family protein [Thiobacillaceae bacterium]
MNLFVTLFGGMLATALLYALGRRLRLSNFWAAVSAAGLTVSAYLAHVVLHRPGLDVITLHLVAYPTIALLLNQLYGGRTGLARNVHWVPKLLLAFFAVLTVLYGGFIYVAAHGLPQWLAAWWLPHARDGRVYTGFAGVVEHDRGAAKVIATHMRTEQRLAERGWRVEIEGLRAPRADQPQPVRVRVTDRQDLAVTDLAVKLQWARPGQRTSAAVELAADGHGDYRGSLPPLPAGGWVVYLSLERSGADLIRLEHSLQVH